MLIFGVDDIERLEFVGTINRVEDNRVYVQVVSDNRFMEVSLPYDEVSTELGGGVGIGTSVKLVLED